MAGVRSFRDLDAWQLAMSMVELTYRLTADFPDAERFGLVSQMRRAAVSVPSNIAEGQAVRSARWSLRFVVTAIGSLAEVETQLEIALRLHLTEAAAAHDLRQTIGRLRQILYGLRRGKQQRLGLSLSAAPGVLLVAVGWVLWW